MNKVVKKNDVRDSSNQNGWRQRNTKGWDHDCDRATGGSLVQQWGKQGSVPHSQLAVLSPIALYAVPPYYVVVCNGKWNTIQRRPAYPCECMIEEVSYWQEAKVMILPKEVSRQDRNQTTVTLHILRHLTLDSLKMR